MRLRVVLVEPMYDGNVGSVARAMKNFGFHDLVMVRPCRIGDYGLAMASHARDVLQMSRSFASLPEALEGASIVVGTTGKRLEEAQHHLRLHLRVPCLSPAELAEKLKGKDGTIALLLGREDCGLNSDELANCDMLVSIPTSSEYPVMNLSHSSAVLLYELFRTCEANEENVEMASPESLALLHEKLRTLLQEIRYPVHKINFTMIMLRRIIGRAVLTEREARSLLGIIKSIRWRMENPGADRAQEADDAL
ncbi:tRNA (cytidine(34)-2'-O)-methyltransferase [uncultured archaeon]|nr:tRNA (cytidine(34)-2'-O)-methyltransferase [uncultured archaeon]